MSARSTDSFLTGLARDGRALVGGDISFSRAQEPVSADEKRFLEQRGALSIVATTRAMVAKESGETALADIKAVEQNYPLVGTVGTTPAIPPSQLGADTNGTFGALLDPALIARLSLKIGDTIRIGTARFVVRAAIDDEPDRLVAGAALAPRLIMSRTGLQATGLVTPEALVRWAAKLSLAQSGDRPASDAQVATAVAAFKQAFPQSGFEIARARTHRPRSSGSSIALRNSWS